MGCHKVKLGNTEGMYFAVWAPGARRVSVVGDFNYWNGMLYPMHKMENSDIFELFIPGLSCGQFYKFEIKRCTALVKYSGDISNITPIFLLCERFTKNRIVSGVFP